MKISILGSGSSGNATFIGSGATRILVDAGFSCRKIEEKLNAIGESAAELSAVLLTHEHMDHIAGAGILSRKYDIPLYLTAESHEAGRARLGEVPGELIRYIRGDFILGDDLEVIPFDVMHDAVRTMGFRLNSDDGRSVAIATDIGHVDNVVRENFRDCDVVVIESNYDHAMLLSCGYPFELKNRIKSNNGHLSNESAARFIRDIYHGGLQKVWLAHVSRDSNTYDRACETTRRELEACGIRLDFEAARQDEQTGLFEVK